MTDDPLDDLRAAGMPERFGLIAERLAAMEKQAAELRKFRDDSIKEYAAATGLGPTKLAQAAGVSVSTVKAVLR